MNIYHAIIFPPILAGHSSKEKRSVLSQQNDQNFSYFHHVDMIIYHSTQPYRDGDMAKILREYLT